MVVFLVVPQTQVHLMRKERCDEGMQRVDGMSMEFQFSVVSFQSRHTMLSGADAIRGIDRGAFLVFLFPTIAHAVAALQEGRGVDWGAWSRGDESFG